MAYGMGAGVPRSTGAATSASSASYWTKFAQGYANAKTQNGSDQGGGRRRLSPLAKAADRMLQLKASAVRTRGPVSTDDVPLEPETGE